MLSWTSAIGRSQWRTLVAAQLGWMLDAFDVMLYAFALSAVREEFQLTAAHEAVDAKAEAVTGRVVVVADGSKIETGIAGDVAGMKTDIEPAPVISRDDGGRRLGVGPRRQIGGRGGHGTHQKGRNCDSDLFHNIS